jgi:hypothetical protein
MGPLGSHDGIDPNSTAQFTVNPGQQSIASPITFVARPRACG